MTTVRADPAPPRDLAPSALALIAANVVPLVGVVAFHWSIFAIVLLYWCENVVVGAFNVLKILFAEPQEIWANLSKLFLIPFFVVHYGMFTFVHGMFVLVFFGTRNGAPPNLVGFDAAIRQTGVGIGVLALIASHGFSFFQNYLFNGEYRRMSPQLLMTQPYGRVIVMHLTILVGAIATQSLGSPVAVLLVLIVLKTAMDWRAHGAERRKLALDPVGRPGPAVGA